MLITPLPQTQTVSRELALDGLNANAQPHFACDYDALVDVLMCLQQPMALVSADGTVVSVNSAAALLLGDHADTFIGEFWPGWLAAPFEREYSALFTQGLVPFAMRQHNARDVQLHGADGHLHAVRMSLSFVPGILPVFLIGFEDMSEHKREIKRLQALASTDCLTGLANRRSMNEQLEKLWHSCVARRTPISIVMVDVDYFKQFNDVHGHLKGDECLKQIATVLTSVLPSTQCLAARFGGEEFVLVLPGFNVAMAQLVAQQVSEGIAALDRTTMGLPSDAVITVSQGIATESCGQFRTPEAMLQCADTALYRSKRDGRNRITVSD